MAAIGDGMEQIDHGIADQCGVCSSPGDGLAWVDSHADHDCGSAPD
jgi:hypothetical protein